MENRVSGHAVIRGRVQGVFFRMETKRIADEHGVFGWVKNQRDGTVEAVFEGEQERVAAVLKWCKKGPSGAVVKDVDVTWGPYTGHYRGFDITF